MFTRFCAGLFVVRQNVTIRRKYSLYGRGSVTHAESPLRTPSRTIRERFRFPFTAGAGRTQQDGSSDALLSRTDVERPKDLIVFTRPLGENHASNSIPRDEGTSDRPA
jgi:hypothetical protein